MGPTIVRRLLKDEMQLISTQRTNMTTLEDVAKGEFLIPCSTWLFSGKMTRSMADNATKNLKRTVMMEFLGRLGIPFSTKLLKEQIRELLFANKGNFAVKLVTAESNHIFSGADERGNRAIPGCSSCDSSCVNDVGGESGFNFGRASGY